MDGRGPSPAPAGPSPTTWKVRRVALYPEPLFSLLWSWDRRLQALVRGKDEMICEMKASRSLERKPQGMYWILCHHEKISLLVIEHPNLGTVAYYYC